MMTAAPMPAATGSRSHETPSRTRWPHTSVLTRTRCMALCVPDRPTHQVFHQRDLEVVEVEWRSALCRGLAGQRRAICVLRAAGDRILHGLESARHALHRSAREANLLDDIAVDERPRVHTHQREVPRVAVGDFLEIKLGARPFLREPN